MIVCPVCEHQQAAGFECENCGKQFVKPTTAAVPVAPMLELEQTRLVRPGLNVASEPMAELERTRMQSGPDLPAQRVVDLESTSVPTVGAVPVQAVPELDLGREQDDGVRTAAPVGAVICRYCRNVQETGLLCEKCGMRLSRVPSAPASVQTATAGEGEWTRCKDCGSRARRASRCSNCGNEVPA
ncbi:MAG: hypothetical protein M3Y59_18845 [Myxococcota bacterium]|nr:hypothetical protein [Myxococcota bacterium]